MLRQIQSLQRSAPDPSPAGHRNHGHGPGSHQRDHTAINGNVLLTGAAAARHHLDPRSSQVYWYAIWSSTYRYIGERVITPGLASLVTNRMRKTESFLINQLKTAAITAPRSFIQALSAPLAYDAALLVANAQDAQVAPGVQLTQNAQTLLLEELANMLPLALTLRNYSEFHVRTDSDETCHCRDLRTCRLRCPTRHTV